MLSSVLRKASRLVEDPVLRRWAIGVVFGRHARPARFTPHRPPYLHNLSFPAGNADRLPEIPADFRALDASAPDAPITLNLPGERVTLEPGAADSLYARKFADIETLLAVHRFAWLPLLGAAADPGWVDALWRAWTAQHATPDGSWAWHPYTVAERAINMLDYARRVGLPGAPEATVALLARHAPAIAERLEYFGEHNTSNHLSNNGRGLFRLGLDLGMQEYADLGGRILLAEAARIFAPSGVLREGSSHYHLLLTRNYLDAWRAARAFERPEAGALEQVARRALEAVPCLLLPGGMPLVGDISPDCPPDHLAGLLPGGELENGWCGLLPEESRAALAALKESCRPVSPDRVASDGWTRFSAGPWSALWHAAPGGWPPMPGHGHQDTASFELHYRRFRVFVDPGRGAYGQTGEAARYASSSVHNTLMVDGHDPYPANRPYYDDVFRLRVGGHAPQISRERDGITLDHDGFARLEGVATVRRRFAFDATSMRITDRVEGASERTITRCLHTTCPVKRTSGGAILETAGNRFRLHSTEPFTLSKATCWAAYGEGVSSTLIEYSARTRLPFESTLVLEAI